MIELTAEQAGRALGRGPLSAAVTGVSIDSRSLRPGDLFVALRGERLDGHEFVGGALAAGACAVVVERKAADRVRRELAGSAAPIYVVDDSLRALWGLAREVRRRSTATVFAITGSVGKTSTKDLLAAMVGQVRRVVATSANQNNEVGVALTLFNVEPATEAVVVEMGMRGLGQIAQLAEVVEPDIGLITNVHPVHLELLGTVERVAQAKAELLTGLRPGGVAVVPEECALLQPHIAEWGHKAVRFAAGRDAVNADVRGWIEPASNASGYVFGLRWPEGEVGIETGAMWSHTVANAVAAAAACYAARLPVQVCAVGINEARLSAGRGELITLSDFWIIDDTYNANPAAVRAAVDNLVALAAEKGARPVAVLGDMLELGPRSELFHREIGAYAQESGVRMLWGVGRESVATVDGFCERWRVSGSAETECTAGHIWSAEEASTVIASLRAGDAVLFKASRSMRLETMVRRVLDHGDTTTKETG